ncbi:hypothetical protein ACHQM5_028579 [Ranunculus cassubicifolius]
MSSLSALLNLYIEQGKWRELTTFCQRIRKEGCEPNSFIFTSLLKSCISLPLPLLQCKSLHADAKKTGFLESDSYVINALITMYAKCHSIHNAHKVFDEIPSPSVVNWNTIISSFFRVKECDGARDMFLQMRKSEQPNDITWSAMIAGYTRNARPREGLLVFKQMIGERDEMGLCIVPNSNTIASVFSACGQLSDLGVGEQVHGYTVKISEYIEREAFVGCALIDFYGKCCRHELAKLVFDSMIDNCVVAWSAMIAAYVRNECPLDAIDAFRKMVLSGTEPNCITLSTLITACANIPSLILGKEVHSYIIRQGDIKPDVFVSTSLIDMYGKCCCMVYARRILEKDTAILECVATPMWNATFSGYVENNCFDDAWTVFRRMNQDTNTKPNSVTMAIAIPLCIKSSKLQYGKVIHCYAIKTGLDAEVFVGNSLLDMYSKCGNIHLAENQFKRMIKKNTVSWTSMIDAYGIHGDGEGAIKVFKCMVDDKDVKPDHVTFVALVSACSHAGLVEEGLNYFRAMSKEYGIDPAEENYGSVVDLLARAGHIDKAKYFIASMPIKPGANVWGALLGACKIHGDVKEAEHAAEKLLSLEPKESGFRKLLSSVYSNSGNLDGVADVMSAMRETRVGNRQGFSWVETDQSVHEFVAGDNPHVHL